MSFDGHAQRAELHEGIQRAVAEHEDGALVTGWFLIAEVRDPSGQPYLAYRTGDINGDGLTSWTSLGYLHSAATMVEEQSWGSGFRPGEDDGSD